MRLRILLVLCACLVASNAQAELVAFYDFNDASDSDVAQDSSGFENHGTIYEAEYTGAGEGQTGAAEDRALDFGFYNNDAYVDIESALDGAFESITENDQATISMWIFGSDEQPSPQWNFYAGPGRQLGSHTPWSDGNLYFDVAGCCNADQRISGPIGDLETYSGEWNHYAFIKDEVYTAVYQNGELLIDAGEDVKSPLFEITEFFIGAGPAGDRRSYSGLIDDFGIWDVPLSEEDIEALANNSFFGPTGPPGDFNENGMRDDEDFDLLATAVINGDASFDLDGDGDADAEDRRVWVEDLSNTHFGDSNWDGEFNSSDFVTVFAAGKYETGEAAGWAEGDWNGDKLFNSSDFVTAFTGGGYEMGPKEGGLMVVPEPATCTLLLAGLVAMIGGRRR